MLSLDFTSRLNRSSFIGPFLIFLCLLCVACESSPESILERTAEAQVVSSPDEIDSDNAESEDEVSPFAVTDLSDKQAADPFLGFVDSRNSTLLNGAWHRIVDPVGIGEPRGFFPGFPRNKRGTSGMELIEYDFETSSLIDVPGAFNAQEEQLLFYQGRVWYYRTFEAKITADTKYHLWFGGANFSTDVFLNGEPVGGFRNGYVPFSWDVTDLLHEGQNTLIVKVDNKLSGDTVPTNLIDWWPYGGLTRDVMLVETPIQYIQNAKISLTHLDAREIEVKIQTVGIDAGEVAQAIIPELNLRVDIPLGSDGFGEARFTAPVELWSPQTPRLYDVTFQVGEDAVSDKVGFRTIETEGTEILLNGAPLKLRGISMHEEPIIEGVVVQPGPSHSEEQALRLLSEAKALNANFVRAAHYPHSRHLAKVADQLGLLLWEEVPVYWTIDFDNPQTLSNAIEQLDRLVRRDWNRASVIVWSVANETPQTEARMTFLGHMIAHARDLDATRLISAALLGGNDKQFQIVEEHLAARGLAKSNLSERDAEYFSNLLEASDNPPNADDKLVIEIEDRLSALTDIVAYNQYYGWYYTNRMSDRSDVNEAVYRPLMLELMNDMSIESASGKPVIISETGAGAQAGRLDEDALVWSENYQADVYKAQLEIVKNSAQVQGLTPWILKDFRTMVRTLPGIQDNYNRKGLIDETGRRKQSFDILKDFYESGWQVTESDLQ